MKQPDQNETARRALCLGALVMRGKFESISASGSPQMVAVHEGLATQLNMWIADEGLIVSQSTSEKPVVCKALGSWTSRELVEAGWRANSLGVILWALSVFDELPPWDMQFTPQETIKPLNLFAPIKTFLDQVTLRPAAEIEHAREVAQLWQWRAHIHGLLDEEAQPNGEFSLDDLEERVALVAAEAQRRGNVAELIDGDLPAFGKAYATLSPEESSDAASIARERLYALNWLCGLAADWDAVPIETDEKNLLP